MTRSSVSLYLDAQTVSDAKSFNLDLSQIVEDAIKSAVMAEKSRRWREENKDAIEAYADELSREGLPLSCFRSF